MNSQHSMSRSPNTAAGRDLPRFLLSHADAVRAGLMMLGSALGAVLITVYCWTFLDSNVAMAMGMIGAVAGAMLTTLLDPVVVRTVPTTSGPRSEPYRDR
jgi:hypothetical protein